jgi:hypothetical protein
MVRPACGTAGVARELDRLGRITSARVLSRHEMPDLDVAPAEMFMEPVPHPWSWLVTLFACRSPGRCSMQRNADLLMCGLARAPDRTRGLERSGPSPGAAGCRSTSGPDRSCDSTGSGTR